MLQKTKTYFMDHIHWFNLYDLMMIFAYVKCVL